MSISRVLVANRGEIARRVLDAAADLGLDAVAVHGDGPATYLDVDALVAAGSGCDAVHPGYGFLSEDAGFARASIAAGMTWVGPSPEFLELFGDKASARAHAVALGVPVAAGTGTVDLAGALAFAAGVDGPVMIKAVSGEGRGMRAVAPGEDLAAAYERCRSEAGGDVLVEELRTGARHVEVQLIGDGERVLALGDRDCSVQRRHQKIIEFAPAGDVPVGLHEAAVRLAAGLRGVATAEFLVDARGFVFLEVNPRIQVEHTVTEEVTGVDLVTAQLRLAGGATLADLGLDVAPTPRGVAVQLRVNAETLTADGDVRPGAGTLTRFEPPSGRGIRVDTAARAGTVVDPRFDPLLAKLVVTAPDRRGAIGRAGRALAAFEVEGVATNRPLLEAILRHPGLATATTSFVDDHRAELLAEGQESHFAVSTWPQSGFAGTPGAVLAPLAGVVVEVIHVGDLASTHVAVLESMKMEHPVAAAGRVVRLAVAVGTSWPRAT